LQPGGSIANLASVAGMLPRGSSIPLASEDAGFVTGANLLVEGGASIQ
jgi:hypothetical protein